MKKFQIWALCAFLMIGFQSCEDFLEEEDCGCGGSDKHHHKWEDCDNTDSLDYDMDWNDMDSLYDDIDSLYNDMDWHDMNWLDYDTLDSANITEDNGVFEIIPVPELIEDLDWDVKISTPQNGQIEQIEDLNAFIYTPKAGFKGTETVTFTFTDKDGETFEVTIDIEVKQGKVS